MIYCIATTKAHPVVTQYFGIVNCIDQLLLSEGCDLIPTPFDGKGYDVINGDELERAYSIAIGRGEHNKSKSMDLIFGINTSSFQFVELKFKSYNFRWLDKSSFAEKVNGTKEALGATTNVNSVYYIVFKIDRIQQARNYLFRQHPVLNNQFKVVDTIGLFNEFFT